MSNEENIEEIRLPKGVSPPSNGGNGTKLIDHRLKELERRVGEVEKDVKDISLTCTRIESEMKNMANKSYVLWVFVGIGGISILSFLGHLLINFFMRLSS